MPELPEVETTLRGIEPYLTGGVVKSIHVLEPRLRWPVPADINSMQGATITTLWRRAKYLILQTTSGYALIHLGMSGSLRVLTDHEPLRKHDHIELQMDSGVILRYHDPRRFGAFLWTTDRPEQHALLASLGPEPLGNEFNGALLIAKSRKKKVAVKNFIMDNHVVVGVGNIYANEALFLAGVRPTIAAGRISHTNYERIADAIREVLAHAISMGGTTLRDFVNSKGEPGYFQQTLNVYGREGEPCRKCHHKIKQQTIGQRSSFYCSNCQH